MLLGGDFRQNLPVVNKGSRADIVNSSLNRSMLWEYCHLYSLHQNMRLHSGNSVAENKAIDEFNTWVLRVGDGKEVHECEDDDEQCNAIRIPDEYVLHTDGDKIEAIIDATYPNLMTNFLNPQYLKDRAILSPTNAVVDDINKRILQRIPGKLYTYLSIDSIDDGPAHEDNLESSFPVEYLNSINIAGLPKHELALKEGIVVMLMRNLNQIFGLCNGTRMIIRKCMKNTLLVRLFLEAILVLYTLFQELRWPQQIQSFLSFLCDDNFPFIFVMQ
ncbi:uncharacterized protein LOC141718526 [Apium graveolens]|uniref:uncharacterized protein LOC141718526 n=1 Tax=Apium graveolens TaxID=4045 RepID=UPI003D7B65C8